MACSKNCKNCSSIETCTSCSEKKELIQETVIINSQFKNFFDKL
jgi:hypothetical protein